MGERSRLATEQAARSHPALPHRPSDRSHRGLSAEGTGEGLALLSYLQEPGAVSVLKARGKHQPSCSASRLLGPRPGRSEESHGFQQLAELSPANPIPVPWAAAPPLALLLRGGLSPPLRNQPQNWRGSSCHPREENRAAEQGGGAELQGQQATEATQS